MVLVMFQSRFEASSCLYSVQGTILLAVSLVTNHALSRTGILYPSAAFLETATCSLRYDNHIYKVKKYDTRNGQVATGQKGHGTSGHWTNGKKAARSVGSDQVGSGHQTSGKWPLDKWEKATEKVQDDQVESGHQTSGKWPPDKRPLIKCSKWTAGHWQHQQCLC